MPLAPNLHPFDAVNNPVCEILQSFCIIALLFSYIFSCLDHLFTYACFYLLVSFFIYLLSVFEVNGAQGVHKLCEKFHFCDGPSERNLQIRPSLSHLSKGNFFHV